jgi:hypothetical protein
MGFRQMIYRRLRRRGCECFYREVQDPGQVPPRKWSSENMLAVFSFLSGSQSWSNKICIIQI